MLHDRAFDGHPGVSRTEAQRSRRTWTLPSLRQAWFQVHWFIGITAGSVLMLIGLTGAMLAFREEITDALDPGVRHVAPRAEPMLGPQGIVDAMRIAKPDERVASVILYAEPGAAARVTLSPPPGQRRGETVYVDPYTGAEQPALRAGAFFETVEMLHRFLLLPRETGRVVAGTLASCLFVMALSGLYLRWPRRVTDWRAWLHIDPRKKGRPFLWALHAVPATFALVCYLVSTSSGIYWAFDAVRQPIDRWLGFSERTERAAMKAPGKDGERARKGEGSVKSDSGPDQRVDSEGGRRGRAKAGGDAHGPDVELTAAWAAFRRRAQDWQLAQVRIPARPAQPAEFSWLEGDAPHERARSRMTIRTDSGEIVRDERFATLGAGERAQAAIYPLHMGTYWGLPGRIVMMMAALSLPLFGITGWMMYLGRRRVKAAAVLERRRLGESAAVATDREQTDPVLVAFASQTGHAERLALQAAGLLQRAGLTVVVQSLAHATPATFATHSRVLIVAASFGDGDPPDGVRRFARLLDEHAGRFGGLRYGILALGDRAYANFCGFGHALDRRLGALGATALFPVVEVDDGDTTATMAAVAAWTTRLGEIAGVALDPREETADADTARPAEPFVAWTVVRRVLLNEGSAGAPLYEVSLANDESIAWAPGMLVEVLPRHAPATVVALLAKSGLEGDAPIEHSGARTTLGDALARSELPDERIDGPRSPQAVVDGLKLLVPRKYSIASLPADGVLQLIVRQERHAWGLGLASGWLTVQAIDGDAVAMRIVANPAFEAVTEDVPCIFIGNGSGYAGLRAHLRARVRAGRHRNWLVFGERQRAVDRIGGDELNGWVAGGFLQRVDLAFSRDGGMRKYVQDHLRDAAIEVRAWIAEGAVIFVCGSLDGMATGVDDALTEILGRDRLEALIDEGRYRRDVY